MITMIPTALRLLVLSTLLIGATELTWCAEKTSKLAPVRIAYVSRSILDMPYVIARDRGFFREEGLEAEFVFMKAIQTVQAMLAENAELAVAVAKHHQVLAQQPRAHGLAVALGHLLRHAYRQPVPARELAHGSAAFHPAKKLVLFLG